MAECVRFGCDPERVRASLAAVMMRYPGGGAAPISVPCAISRQPAAASAAFGWAAGRSLARELAAIQLPAELGAVQLPVSGMTAASPPSFFPSARWPPPRSRRSAFESPPCLDGSARSCRISRSAHRDRPRRRAPRQQRCTGSRNQGRSGSSARSRGVAPAATADAIRTPVERHDNGLDHCNMLTLVPAVIAS